MAQTLKAYHLNLLSPIHPGIESIGQEKTEDIIRSDTLWGALIQSWMLLFDDDCEDLVSSPPFKISSCFPVIKERRYLPLPIGALDTAIEQSSEEKWGAEPSVKHLKRVRFVSEELFGRVARGERVQLKEVGPADVFPSFEKESAILLVKGQRPRIRVNQLTGGVEEASFFYCTDNFFCEGAGLFFLVSFTTEEAERKFDAALRLLGDNGLGGDRSIGKGRFSYEKKEFHVESPNGESVYCLLSLYRPSKEEVSRGILTHKHSAYGLTRRSGRASSIFTSRFRRADTWMLTEGSILPFDPVGTVPVVLKESDEIPHRVYRYGLALTVSISSEGLGK